MKLKMENIEQKKKLMSFEIRDFELFQRYMYTKYIQMQPKKLENEV